jgi:hypothetical protein
MDRMEETEARLVAAGGAVASARFHRTARWAVQFQCLNPGQSSASGFLGPRQR